MERGTVGQVLHGSATTTEAVRRAIQNSQESLRTLARRHGINPKTVAKWKKRPSVADLPTDPSRPKSTVLSIEEEAMIVPFRRHTLLPLDDCFYALQSRLPHLTRSSLHRCLKRHGISRLPDTEGERLSRGSFKSYPIGYIHVDIAEVRTEESKLYLFVAVDRTSKFAFVALHEKADRPTAAGFLQNLVAALPYRINTVLTDNGLQFADLPHIRHRRPARHRVHPFDELCRANGIDHRLTKPNHPWTTDEVECPFRGAVLFFARLRMTSRRRVGLEVKARPRCLHCRSSFEASADTRLPRLVQPWVNRLYAASARSPRWRSSRRDRARLYA